MMFVKCHLARSSIDGLGVFASEPIACGSLVWRFDRNFDILVPKAVLAAAPPATRAFWERFAYQIAQYPDHMALDGDDGRFMNHAEAPNLDFSRPGQARALRDIPPGEELTCDYAHLASEDFELRPTTFEG